MKTELQTVQITRNELVNVLRNNNRSMFISMVTNCPVKMNRYLDYWLVDENGKKRKNPNPTVNPFFTEGIIDHSEKYRIVTGFDYERSVNRRREKEGKETDFVSGEGKEVWFNMVSKSLVTDKKTGEKFYLRYQFHPTSTLNTEYRFGDDVIGRELFQSFMTQKTESYKNQGLDDTLNFQVVNVENIEEISIEGFHYILSD